MVGLHLAALSMRNRSDPVDFALKIAQHGHQAIAEYLPSEVLAGLPETQRDCLLQTSLFNRFCAPLIDWVQADDGLNLAGDDFVRDIQRANLFVVSLDDQGTWLRYHHFFQSLFALGSDNDMQLRKSKPYTHAPVSGSLAGLWAKPLLMP